MTLEERRAAIVESERLAVLGTVAVGNIEIDTARAAGSIRYVVVRNTHNGSEVSVTDDDLPALRDALIELCPLGVPVKTDILCRMIDLVESMALDGLGLDLPEFIDEARAIKAELEKSDA
jgi:hypothetical protein